MGGRGKAVCEGGLCWGWELEGVGELLLEEREVVEV